MIIGVCVVCNGRGPRFKSSRAHQLSSARTPLMEFYTRKKQEKGSGKALCAQRGSS